MTAPLEVRCTAATYERLVRHLAGSSDEQLAFLAAHLDASRGALQAFELKLLTPEDFHLQTTHHLSLADEAGGRVIRWAHQSSASLVEAHAHQRSARVAFSPSDLDGLQAWVPHVRWRLPERPYAALVFGADSLDGLVWDGTDRAPRQLAGLRVDGRLHAATAETLRRYGEGWRWTSRR